MAIVIKKCSICGVPIGDRRKYCLDCALEVRRRYARERYRAHEYQRPARPCVVCGGPCKPTAMYCSDECRSSAERQRDHSERYQPLGYAPAPVKTMPRGWNMDRGYIVTEAL